MQPHSFICVQYIYFIHDFRDFVGQVECQGQCQWPKILMSSLANYPHVDWLDIKKKFRTLNPSSNHHLSQDRQSVQEDIVKLEFYIYQPQPFKNSLHKHSGGLCHGPMDHDD